MDLTRRLVRGTAANAGGAALGQLAELATVAVAVARLGTAPYGLVVLSIALLEWPAMLEPGPGQTVARLTSAASLDDRARRLLRTAVAAYGALGVATLAVGLAVTPLVVAAADVPGAAQGRAALAVRLFVVAAAVRMATGFVNRALLGHARLVALRAGDLLRAAVTLGAVVAVAARGWDAAAPVAAAYLAGEVARAVAGLALLGGSARDLAGLPTRESLADLWDASRPLLVTNAASVLSYRVDPLIAAVALGPTATAVYGVVHRVFETLRGGADLLALGILPAASRLASEGDGPRIRGLFLRSYRYLAVVVWPAAAALAVLHDEVLREWLRRELPGSGPPLVAAMALVVLTVPGIVASPIVIGADRVRRVVRVQVFAAPLNLAVGILLVRPLGVSALFVGTIVATLVVSRRYVDEVTRLAADLGDDAGLTWSRAIAAAARPAVIVAGFALALAGLRAVVPGGLAGLAAGAGVAGAAYAAAVFRWAVPFRELFSLWRPAPDRAAGAGGGPPG